jgi:hypothetical protein
MNAHQSADKIVNAASKYSFDRQAGETVLSSHATLLRAFHASREAEAWDADFAAKVHAIIFNDEA